MRRTIRFLAALACVFLAFALAACGGDDAAAPAGQYLLDGRPDGPYLILDADAWRAGGGLAVSYTQRGECSLDGNALTLRANGEPVAVFTVGRDGSLTARDIVKGALPWISEGAVFRPADEVLYRADLSADEARGLADAYGLTLLTDGTLVSGGDAWEAFVNKTQAGQPAAAVVASYWSAEKLSSAEEPVSEPQLLYTRVVFDGKVYTAYERASDGGQENASQSFRYMNHYTDKLPGGKTCDVYALTESPDVTWDDLQRSMYSSDTADHIPNRIVYQSIDG